MTERGPSVDECCPCLRTYGGTCPRGRMKCACAKYWKCPLGPGAPSDCLWPGHAAAKREREEAMREAFKEAAAKNKSEGVDWGQSKILTVRRMQDWLESRATEEGK